MRTALVLILGAAAILAGCATTPNESTNTTTTPPRVSSNQVLNFTATQSPGEPNENTTYSFTGPTTARPGWAALNLKNDGGEPHQIIVYKLPAGMTFAAHAANMASMMQANATNDPHAGLMPMGGVGAALPGQNSTTWVHLTPGTYSLECEIPGPGGPHFLHGMMQAFTVTDEAEVGSEPTPTATLTLSNYSFAWSAVPTAGNNIIKVVNTAEGPHEAVLVQLVGNVTTADFATWATEPIGPPPISEAFGVGVLAPGGVNYIQHNFAPSGNYGEICFLPDDDGHPHFVEGMIGQFEVT